MARITANDGSPAKAASLPGNTFEEKFERGKALFKELNTRDSSKLKPGMSGFNDVTFAHLFGDLWCRGELSLRQRSFVVCSALIALGKEEELKVHFPGLLNQGYTRAQIEEMCVHLAHYSGWPTCVGGRRALDAVFKDPQNKAIVDKASAAPALPPRTGAYVTMPGQTTAELFERGKVLMKELTGNDNSKLKMGVTGFTDVTFANLFGDLWCRDGLSLFERSLLVNSALIALGKEEELAGAHAPGLLNQGFTQAQYEEVCLHLAHYSGWPSAVGGRRALTRALKAKQAKSKL